MRELAASLLFYVDVLGLERLGGFTGHDGYDGAFIGRTGSDWHLELTCHESGVPVPTPTDEDLLVLYVSEVQLRAAAKNLGDGGFEPIRHENPYWADAGAVVCRDPDGYQLILFPNPD